ncbi:hypothetical protein AQUCO_04100073v1 [Aquilegia coerulea]|uniref:Wall-associated receptor kinase galacturonan-binding domain-containing protein n=1 Tax=Aquilegia coerulea TaxID=218851 RepID=A0A2G5CQ31_AQUCA|nr:hypothetical protein AQUCO_04100073v1 [Aquilegia coerulea]
MDSNHVYLFNGFFFLVIFFLVVGTVLSADKNYEACVTANCGNGPNISYPFWINDIQNSTCGFPGFELSCKSREPILTMSGEEYIIRDIVYGNESFTIVKAGLANDICSPPSYKLSFSHLPFRYVATSVNLSVFFNCTGLPSSEYSRYLLGCGTAEPTNRPRNSSVALFSDDPMLRSVREIGKCDNSVVIPVDKIGNGSLDTFLSREYVAEFLNEGFHLRWTASRCDECAESGGRCGFDFDRYKFICFCTDRPHHRRCNNGKYVKDRSLVFTLFETNQYPV